MKLKYHLDLPKEGFLILESEPQMRTLCINSQTQFAIRLPLPYVQFAIRYFKIKNRFHYPGLWGCGLRVTGSLNSLSSINDKVHLLGTGDNQAPIICTPHHRDMDSFKNLNELVEEVITMWYSLPHTLNPRWKNSNLEEIKWASGASRSYLEWLSVYHGLDMYFSQYKSSPTRYGHPNIPSWDIKLPIKVNISDEQWDRVS